MRANSGFATALGIFVCMAIGACTGQEAAINRHKDQVKPPTPPSAEAEAPTQPTTEGPKIDPTAITSGEEFAHFLNTSITWNGGETVVYEGLNTCEPIADGRLYYKNPERIAQLEAELQQAKPEDEYAASTALMHEKNTNYYYKDDQVGYKCFGGYLTITSPQGAKTCKIQQVYYSTISGKGVENRYNEKECRWR